MSNIDEEAKNNFTIEMRIFDNQNHEFWHSVIKPWFQPERFGITHLWFLWVLCLGMPLTCVGNFCV